MRHLTTECLVGLAEGRLSPQARQLAEQHIETCAMCFAEAAEWVSLVGGHAADGTRKCTGFGDSKLFRACIRFPSLSRS